MTNESTINKLIEMRLTAMADAFRIRKDAPSMKEVPFDDRLGMLVDIEYSSQSLNSPTLRSCDRLSFRPKAQQSTD